MRFFLRLAIALAVLLPTVVVAGVHAPLPLFGVALVAFGAGQLAARFAGRAVRAALLALSGIAIVVTGAHVMIPREAVDAFRNVDQVTSSMAGRRLRVRGTSFPAAPRRSTSTCPSATSACASSIKGARGRKTSATEWRSWPPARSTTTGCSRPSRC